MAVGFTSRRICHMCPGEETQLNLKKSKSARKYLMLLPHTPTISWSAAQSQEWWNMSPEGQARSWNAAVPDPFKPGPRSPLLEIPGGGSANICKPDILHVFNLGVGADLACGAIIAIYRMGLWKGSSVKAALNNAYDRFRDWCRRNRKSPFIKHFDLMKFHMTSLPSWIFSNDLGPSSWKIFPEYRVAWCFGFKFGSVWYVRLQSWPTGGGKAHDTALLCKWLDSELSMAEKDSVVPWLLCKNLPCLVP